MRQELVLELKQLEITLKDLILEFKKHNSKLKSYKNNTRQKNVDFEYVRKSHLTNQQNYVKNLLYRDMKLMQNLKILQDESSTL